MGEVEGWFWELVKREVEEVVLEILDTYGPEAWEEVSRAVEEIALDYGLEEEEVEELKAYARRVWRRELGW